MHLRKQLHAPKSLHGRQNGIALVAVLVLTVVAAIVGAAAVSSARTTQKVAHNDLMGKQALIIGDTGINDVRARLKNKYSSSCGFNFNDELASGGTAGAVAGVGTLVDLDSGGINYRFANFGGPGANDGYYVRIVDNFDEVPNDPATDKDGWVEVVSIGRVGTAHREVRARLRASACGFGLYGKDKVTVSCDSQVNSSVGTNGDMSFSGGSTVIDGDAQAAGTVNDHSYVTGTVTEGAPPISLPSVAPCSPFSDGTGIISGNYNASKGELKTAPSIVLAPGTYCFSKLTLSGGNTLTVNGPTVIYLTDKGTISGGGVINTTSNSSNLKIYSSGSDMAISGGSAAYMDVYAPDSKIHVSGGGQYTGSVVGREVTLSGGTEFNYSGTTSSSDTFALFAWREVVQ